MNENASVSHIQNSLKNLTYYLYAHYNEPPILLIDEYDAPIQAGYIHGYYSEMISFIRGFYCAALKDNVYLKKAK